jgi:hypothetical protein
LESGENLNQWGRKSGGFQACALLGAVISWKEICLPAAFAMASAMSDWPMEMGPVA